MTAQKLTMRGMWSPDELYFAGDLVGHAGQSWLAGSAPEPWKGLEPNTTEQSRAAWIQFVFWEPPR